MDTGLARRNLAADADALASGLPRDIRAHARERYGVDLAGRYAGRAAPMPISADFAPIISE